MIIALEIELMLTKWVEELLPLNTQCLTMYTVMRTRSDYSAIKECGWRKLHVGFDANFKWILRRLRRACVLCNYHNSQQLTQQTCQITGRVRGEGECRHTHTHTDRHHILVLSDIGVIINSKQFAVRQGRVDEP